MSDQNKKNIRRGGLAFGAILLLIVLVKLIHIYNNELPSLEQLHNIEPSLTTTIYSADGEVLQEYYLQRRILVPLKKMPPYLIEALLATEDQRFYRHWGVDSQGIIRAFFSNILKGNLTAQGGSTITQQLARTLFLTREKVIRRKIKEILTAVKIERTYSKDEILEMYLNQCNFGKGAYGIQAAAQLYFGKDVEELSVSDCAVLIGLLPAPNRYSPLNNLDYALTRRNVVLSRLAAERKITKSEADSLQKLPLTIAPVPLKHGKAPYFTEMVRQYLEKKYGEKALYTEGLTIYTSLNLPLQKEAEKQLYAMVDTLQKGIEARRTLKSQEYTVAYLDSSGEKPVWKRKYKQLQGALVAMDNSTGEILALVGGRDFDDTKFNRAVQALRQPGSAFKPFVYVAALEKGFHPSTRIDDAPVSYAVGPNGNPWKPENYDRKFRGSTTLQQAVEESVNVVTVKLQERVGIDRTVQVARRLGITSPLEMNLSVALGASDLSLLEITSAYSAFANRGVWMPPVTIRYVTDAQGKLLEEHVPEGHEAVAPEISYLITHMLRGVVERGTGQIAKALGRPVAAKTGTTNDYSNAWFIGFTPRLATGVWVGYDRPRSLGRDETGSRVAAPIWVAYMGRVLGGSPKDEFPMPDRVVTLLVDEDASGECVRPVPMAFLKGTEPAVSCAGVGQSRAPAP